MLQAVFRYLLAFPIIIFFSLALAAASLEPRLVSKYGEIEVPQGMHLVGDRAGERWLLPLDMEVPPEKEVAIRYFKTNVEPREIGRVGKHSILSGPLSALDTIVTENLDSAKNFFHHLPKAFSELLFLEKAANMHAQTSSDLRSLGVFAPADFTTFKLPYIPMPESAFAFAHISDYASKDTKDLLRFKKDGKNYIRFFIHPNYVNAYSELIQKYGIVYHYEAMSSSSPRSLIVVDPASPTKPYWVKVSLHKKLDGSVRINTDKKSYRAIIMSEAIAAVPKQTLQSYGVNFMLEPAAFTPKGMVSSTIHREVASELLQPQRNTRWIPAFILQNTGANAVEGFNIKEMAEAMGLKSSDFIAEHIIRPLLRSYLSMGIIEGLPGELHTQNFYFELKKVRGAWQPTGKLLFKDNDGFRYDTELALRQGRNLNFFAKFNDPFKWGKYSNTIGKGGEGIPFLGSWYYKLIRNVKGFETLSAYMLRALHDLEPRSNWDKDRIQNLFDNIAAEEARKITGIELTRADFGFAKDKGLNKILNEYRAALSLEVSESQKNNKSLQDLLALEWERLKAEKRTSVLRRSLGQATYYVFHVAADGAIMLEARTDKTSKANPDPTIGFAIYEEVGSKNYTNFLRKLKTLAEVDSKSIGTKICKALF